MPTLVRDDAASMRMQNERRTAGADRFDEVWEGTLVIMPQPNTDHQSVVGRMNRVFIDVVEDPGLGTALPGLNVTDQEPNWQENYRCPDVAAILHSGIARNRGTYWLGGPDFLVEVVSEDDGAREKIPFYSRIGVRELLVVDRDPWQLELYRHNGTALVSVGTSTLAGGPWLVSEVLPLKFRLIAGVGAPRIEGEGGRRWIV